MTGVLGSKPSAAAQLAAPSVVWNRCAVPNPLTATYASWALEGLTQKSVTVRFGSTGVTVGQVGELALTFVLARAPPVTKPT